MNPRIDQANLFTRVQVPPGITGEPGLRYQLGPLLGVGATSAVYAAYDTNFSRTVAIKVIEGEVVNNAARLTDFIIEARISASLEHPNIVPVYDMDRTIEGGVYLSMREVAGRSLEEAIEQARAGKTPPIIDGLNDRIHVLLHIANAVACAHDRRIVHRDIKPANIMLGRFGEVFLVDWGTALQLPEHGPAPASHIREGTPFYMSPEQVCGGEIDERSDIYCLGATLFHLVWLRPPTTLSDPESFWQRKAAGVYEPPSAQEMLTVPRRLVAIIDKALAGNPAQRYQNIAAFSADLRAFQAGLAVSAYPEPWYERAERWHRRNARVLWPTVITVATAMAAIGWRLHERQKDLAHWGQPLLNEALDVKWGERWRLDVPDNINEGGGFVINNGALVSTGPASNYIFLRQRLSGPVALEFTGTMRPGNPDGDLSVAWSSEDPFVKTSGPPHRWLLQTGAEDNVNALLQNVYDWVRVDVAPLRLLPGRPYRMRAEIDGTHLRLTMDGRVLLHYETDLPFTGGWIGLYGYYPGKEFRDIKLYAKGLPERVSVLALGDNDAQDGLYMRAAEQYGRVAAAHADSPLGQEAHYRQGLMQRRGGDIWGAAATWSALVGPPAALAGIWRADDLLAAYETRAALVVLKQASRDEPRARQHVALAWVQGLRLAEVQENRSVMNEYLAWQQTTLADEPLVQDPAAMALTWLDRAEEALQRFPHQQAGRTLALMHLGRYEEVIATCTRVQDVVNGMMQLARYADIVQKFPQIKYAQVSAKRRLGWSAALIDDDERHHLKPRSEWLLDVGRIDEVLNDLPSEPDLRGRTLLLAGRFTEALTVDGATKGWARLALGQAQEALALPRQVISMTLSAHGCLLIQAAARRNHEGIMRERAALPLVSFDDLGHAWFARTLLGPLIDACNGDRSALAKALAALHPDQDQQRPAFALRYLSGAIDEAGLAQQPCVQDVPGITALLRALRLDLAGNQAAAVAAYAAWQALPSWRRSIDEARYEPVSETWVAWRLNALR